MTLRTPATVRFHQVDAFATSVFSGNPAGVVILEAPLPDDLMQAIAAENNLAETAFAVRLADGCYALRWFTPTVEVPLCGHATLATAHVLASEMGETTSPIVFETEAAGTLQCTPLGKGAYRLSLPAHAAEPVSEIPGLAAALGRTPVEVFSGHYVMAVLDRPADVFDLQPDLRALAALDLPSVDNGVIVTAAGGLDGADFISRFFAPMDGIDEDSVTGSAHGMLTPYWAAQLGRSPLRACQVSARRGWLTCVVVGDRVTLDGRAVTYLEGTLRLPASRGM